MKIKTWLTAWTCSFCISFGAVSALVTAFELYEVSLTELGLYCLLLCALCGWIFLTKYGAIFLFSLMGGLLVCSLFWQGLWHSVQAVAYQLSTVFDAAYGWGTLDISVEKQAFTQIPAVCFLGALPAIALTWTVCRRERLFFPLILALLPLYPCFIVTDTVPESWCLLLILGAALILILSQALRRLDGKAGHRITAFALIPAILLPVFLMASVPEGGCWDKFPTLQALAGQISQPGSSGAQTTVGMPADNRMDLTSAGSPTGMNQTVMTVRSETSGFLYLRYQSFDSYNGTQWLATELPEDPAFWPEEEDLAAAGYVSITTAKPYDGIFIPYYARNGRYLLLENGKQPNKESLNKYRVSVGLLREQGYATQTPDLTPYLELPDATRAAAQKILQENNLKTPEDILQFVKSSAEYSIQTEAAPKGTKDFAIWFLQEGETGYCIHFATAAAVLLRAAGYPARYVTGYALMLRRARTFTVKENNAHAWVEYAEPESGYLWQVMEATPGDFADVPTPTPTTRPTQPGTQTTPPSTAVPPSTASGTEVPSSTFPSGATAPTGTVNGPTAAPSTQASGQQQETPSVDLSWLWTWFLRFGILLAGIVALWGQYRIRLRKRLKKQHAGTPNQRTLARWREITLLGRLLKTKPPEALLELAEKAKFSQHTVTKEELTQLGIYLQQQRKTIAALPVWKRLVLKLIWAI